MPNTFAYIILISWPFIALIFYKKMPVVNATFWTIVGGFLVLPVKVSIDFPFIPPLDKSSITVISALFGCIYIRKENIKIFPKAALEKWIIVCMLMSPFFTMINNQEAINTNPGLSLHDSFSFAINQYIFVLPLIIGMQLIKTYESQLILFKLLVVAGVFYSFLILYEIRMSPQLHSSLYGFFPHSFGQQKRFDGFRAVVFLGHGLIVAMFVAVTLGSSAILMKEKIKTLNFSSWAIIIYFLILLYLSKTVGAFLLGILLLLSISLMAVNTIRRLSLFLMAVALLYPFLSMLNLFPHESLTLLASDFDPARGESLAFRFHHEKLLLEHAKEKLFFGWGGWGRNRLEDSVTDGNWIIILGTTGLFGFISIFGLLALSIFKASKASVKIKNKKEQRLLIFHSLIVAIIMIDQLPNASLSAWLMFYIGALLGRANSVKIVENKLILGNKLS